MDGIASVSFKNRSIVKIWRTFAEVGGKMAVSIMVVAPDGGITSYAFLEGQSAVVDSAIAAEKASDGAAAPVTAPEGAGEVPAGEAGAQADGASAAGDAPAADGGAEAAPAAGEAEGGEAINFNFDNW